MLEIPKINEKEAKVGPLLVKIANHDFHFSFLSSSIKYRINFKKLLKKFCIFLSRNKSKNCNDVWKSQK